MRNLLGAGAVKLLVLIDGPIEGSMRGPEIRAWELARALAERFEVTVAADVAGQRTRDGVRVVPHSRLRVLVETLRHDAVLAPWLPPYALLAAALRRRVCIADLYDPVDCELATAAEDSRFADELRATRRLTQMQLRFAAVLAFAGEAQRDALLGRRAAKAAEQGSSDRDRTVIVPMGLRGRLPRSRRRPIREAFPAIGQEDVIALWWGGLWRWLDPETAIRAVRQLVDRGSRLKLVFTAGSPGSYLSRLATAEAARGFAADLGLLDRHVFFHERWIPYEDRHGWLAEADLGICLHRSETEGRLAARARYMDYLWARLPCVLSEGGEVGAELARAGLAKPVPLGEPEAAALAIENRIACQGRVADRELECLAALHDWSTVAEPLAAAIEAAAPVARPPLGGLLGEVGSFYLARLGWRVQEVAARGSGDLGAPSARTREVRRA